jgi:hypothetical protein
VKPRSSTAFRATACLGLTILLVAGAAVEASAAAVAIGSQQPMAMVRATQDDAVFSLLSCFTRGVKRLHGQAAIVDARVRVPGPASRAALLPAPAVLPRVSPPRIAPQLIDLPPPAL